MKSSTKKSNTVHRSLEDTVKKVIFERDHLLFTRYFFKARHNNKFKINWHHYLFADIIEDVIQGKLKNVVINVSPGGTKTEEMVVNFIARGIAINPWSRFLHLSYSDDLALLNSQTARDIISSEEYQRMWPLSIADDSKAKKRWNVMFEGKQAGGCYATSLNGQVTGFRAGHMNEGFQGALIIDDPIKPGDAMSPHKLSIANQNLTTTVKSRKANPDTPTVVIMQRVAENDPTRFILDGGLGSDFKHVVIPAIIDEAYVETLAPKYREKVTRDAEGRFSYWPYKEPIEDLLKMERGEHKHKVGSTISRFVFASQYMQNPVAIGGNLIRGNWFKRYTTTPKISYRKIYADTAQKTKEANDYSVFECWGHAADGGIYLLDLLRGKWEAPELESRAIAFWNKHKKLSEIDLKHLGQLREMKVEDKASGTGLIQKLKLLHGIVIKPIERNKDKLTRVMDGVGYIEAGSVFIPEDAPFTNDFVTECEAFTADDSHSHDDQIDPLMDAIEDMLSTGNKMEQWKKLI